MVISRSSAYQCTRQPTKGASGVRQYGFTLVELMVTLVIGLIIVLASMAALQVSRTGFNTLDAAAQLRDNGRFAASLLERLTSQAGYVQPQYLKTNEIFATAQVTPLGVRGFANSKPMGSQNAPDTASDSRSTLCGSSAICLAGGDALVLEYQPASLLADGTTSDKSLINCRGTPVNWTPDAPEQRSISILYVDESKGGEPSLMCKYMDDGAGGTAWQAPQPIVQGVERMELMFGVTDVSPGIRSDPITAGDSDTPTRYLTASQLDVAGDPDGTVNNWRRVRSVRIGLVLRGPPSTAADTSNPQLQPLGPLAPSSTFFTPSTNNDRRLREVFTLTVHLRNYQGS